MSFYEPNLEELVSADHEYLKLLKIIDFEELSRPLEKLYSKLGKSGYPVSTGLKCLFLQFWHDLSDRQLEERMRDSLSSKLFAGFKLREQTPSHSYFGKLRKRIGIKEITNIFNRITESLNKSGLVNNTFTFVDASTIHSIVNLWDARDKALAEAAKNKNDDDDDTPATMNNKNVGKYSSDSDARYGCKGGSNYWYGYKRHTAVDMGTGIITKTDVTPAHVTDADGLELVCPESSMVFADKGYCVEKAQKVMRENKCHSGAILKNNMKAKDFKKDAWLTKVRMPFEGVFSKWNKKTRYRGLGKVQFQNIMQALVHNLRKVVKLEAPPIKLVAI